jgi:hypothetical protein
MELLKQPWYSIQVMPYRDFIKSIKWKVDLEEEKRKKMEERNKTNNSGEKRKNMVSNRVNRGR